MGMPFFTNTTIENSYEPIYNDTISELNDTKIEVKKLRKYTEYLAENIEKLYNLNNNSVKEEIFMTFYLNVDGMTRQQSEQVLFDISNAYNSKEETSNYKINRIFLLVTNQPTKVEIVNPSINNGDIIKSFKDLMDTLDDDKYKELIEGL